MAAITQHRQETTLPPSIVVDHLSSTTATHHCVFPCLYFSSKEQERGRTPKHSIREHSSLTKQRCTRWLVSMLWGSIRKSTMLRTNQDDDDDKTGDMSHKLMQRK
mmetsp:Transcript_6871/g.20172  ORF Transcript_6871/g.20172 Transcript_6871/m.20172 type:complete len:105 (+) Transcript_6871:3057-3371(+)